MNTEAICRTVAVSRSHPVPEARHVFSGPSEMNVVTIVAHGGEFQFETITRWAVCLFRDPEDAEGWVTAEVVAFSGVVSEGATEETALSNAREALLLALEASAKGEILDRRDSYVIPSGGRIAYVPL